MVYNLKKGGNAMTEYLKNYIDQITKRLAECTELSDADDILAEHKDKIVQHTKEEADARHHAEEWDGATTE